MPDHTIVMNGFVDLTEADAPFVTVFLMEKDYPLKVVQKISISKLQVESSTRMVWKAKFFKLLANTWYRLTIETKKGGEGGIVLLSETRFKKTGP